MKQRLKQLEFQEKLKQKLDVVGQCADVNDKSPGVCSTTPTGRLRSISVLLVWSIQYIESSVASI